MTEFNEANPTEKFNTWKGIKIAYERIVKRLQNTLDMNILAELAIETKQRKRRPKGSNK